MKTEVVTKEMFPPLTSEPTLETWRQVLLERSDLTTLDSDVSHSLETGRIVTGHQPVFFHPGILSKYLAAVSLFKHTTRHFKSLTLQQWVVDQDVVDPFQILMPSLMTQHSGNKQYRVVETESIQLSQTVANATGRMIPTSMQPPVDLHEVLARLDDYKVPEVLGIERFQEAVTSKLGEDFRHLAEQVVAIRDALLNEMADGLGMRFEHAYASEIFESTEGAAFLDRLLTTPEISVKTYQSSVEHVPGLTKLIVSSGRMELPIWALKWMQPRMRVYALPDRDENGIRYEVNNRTYSEQELRGTFKLAPRALMLTGLIRTIHSDVFIHGTGGGVYDQATEAWFEDWLDDRKGGINERTDTMAPKLIVTTDLFLNEELSECGNLPVNKKEDLTRAKWRRHHLPHNIDREVLAGARKLPNDTISQVREISMEKKRHLASIDATRDKKQRYQSFQAIHLLNERLQRLCPEMIQDLEGEIIRAKIGVNNQSAMSRRDWPFFLYNVSKLKQLKTSIESQMRTEFSNQVQVN